MSRHDGDLWGKVPGFPCSLEVLGHNKQTGGQIAKLTSLLKPLSILKSLSFEILYNPSMKVFR